MSNYALHILSISFLLFSGCTPQGSLPISARTDDPLSTLISAFQTLQSITLTPSINSTPSLPVPLDSCVLPDSYREIGMVTAVINCSLLEVRIEETLSQINLLGVNCPVGSTAGNCISRLSEMLLGRQILMVFDQAWDTSHPAESEAGIRGAYVFMQDVFINKWLIESLICGALGGQYNCKSEFEDAVADYFRTLYPDFSPPPQIHIPPIPTPDIPIYVCSTNSIPMECHWE